MAQVPSHSSSERSKENPPFGKTTGTIAVESTCPNPLEITSASLISGPKIPHPNTPYANLPDKIFDTSADGFFEWRPQSNKFIFSPSFGSMLGYVPGRLPLNVASIAAHIYSEDYAAVKLSLAKALMSGKDLTLKFRMVTQQATLSWFQMQLRVLTHSEGGQIDSAVACVTNIDHIVKDLQRTQIQANNEQWLRQTIRQLLQQQDDDALTDCLKQFCLFIDVDHIVLRQAINGGERYRLIASGHHSRCPSSLDFSINILRKNMPYGFASAEEGKAVLVEDSTRLPTDTPLFNQRFKELGIRSMATLPIYYRGNIDYYLSLIMTSNTHRWDEITIELAESLGDALAQVAARRQMSQTLERNEARFQNALEASQDGIWDWDIKSDKFFVTPTFLYMLGYDEEFLPLDRGKIAKLLIPPMTLNDFFQDQDNNKGRLECLRSFRHANGHEVPIWIRGNQIAWDDNGKATRCVGVNTNISRFYGKNSAVQSDKIEVVLKNRSSKLPNAIDSTNAVDSISQSKSAPLQAPSNKPNLPNQDQSTHHQPSLDEVFSHSKILLAEDNPINQQVATGILKRKGINVTIVNNGQEAVDMLNSSPLHSFDLVLMDMEMPVLDGYQATRVLRASENFKHLPIIALTAHARDEDRNNCLNQGMNDHVAKPVKPDLLYAAIARHLNHSAVAARH